MAARDAHGRFVKGSGSVKDVDHGYAALLKRVYGIGHPQIATGILAKEGAAAKEVPEGKTPPKEPLELIDVANWMEFGFTEADGTDVPARSFIRAWFDAASPEMRRDLFALMKSVVAGKRTKEDILELLGQKAVGQIQERIANSVDLAPNKPSTVKAKGSSRPLIDTGQLRSGVSYAVREK